MIYDTALLCCVWDVEPPFSQHMHYPSAGDSVASSVIRSAVMVSPWRHGFQDPSFIYLPKGPRVLIQVIQISQNEIIKCFF